MVYVLKYFSGRRFAEVTLAGLTILAEEAMPVAELDKETIARQIKAAEAQLFAAQEVANLKELWAY